MTDKSDKDTKNNNAKKTENISQHSLTIPPNGSGAITGSWLIAGSAHDHVHGPNCSCGHSHDDDDYHDH